MERKRSLFSIVMVESSWWLFPVYKQDSRLQITLVGTKALLFNQGQGSGDKINQTCPENDFTCSSSVWSAVTSPHHLTSYHITSWVVSSWGVHAVQSGVQSFRESHSRIETFAQMHVYYLNANTSQGSSLPSPLFHTLGPDTETLCPLKLTSSQGQRS